METKHPYGDVVNVPYLESLFADVSAVQILLYLFGLPETLALERRQHRKARSCVKDDVLLAIPLRKNLL